MKQKALRPSKAFTREDHPSGCLSKGWMWYLGPVVIPVGWGRVGPEDLGSLFQPSLFCDSKMRLTPNYSNQITCDYASIPAVRFQASTVYRAESRLH